ncbi:carbohydrate-binding domain-containing protein [Carboxylicivirga caseinilyticus]|uniref:carbohydrate-binding domain-containing protein n=1 Tax=Carboxylicivirga caseinilyticus TaxID=3417572 RepID=UPI003D33E48C|nr:carbohydrate-binding domain-containing protein [Marinilabiliaceae bacterium A049]
MKKFLFYILILLAFGAVQYSCDRSSDIESIEDDDDTASGDSHDEEIDYNWDESDGTLIALEGTSIHVEGTGVTVSGTVATIDSSGYYTVTGTLNDGQLRVNSSDSESVHIQLNGANINCSNNAAIYIEDSEKTVIMLADDTSNSLTDGSSYGSEAEANAALYSKSDLTLYGNGTLIINAKYNDGIASKDGLIISSGNYNITSVDDAIRGKDYLIIKDGVFDLDAGGDGFKSDNEDSGTGYIEIDYCDCNIVADGDGIQAYSDLTISEGYFTITCAGGSSGYLSSGASAKALKAGSTLQINAGTFNINTPDDAIHSDDALTIIGGTATISAGDDGLHADNSIEIEDGYIEITKCYEGVESNSITMNGGTVILHSSDDGFNASNGSGSMSATNSLLAINGGFIAVYASGDGLDSNGSVTMTNGTVLVHGPISSGNGALDYDGTFKITGGILVAAGSSGMAEAPSSSSSQPSVLIKFTSSYSAGTLFNLQTSSGEEIVTFKPGKTFQSIVVSSPNLSVGSTYQAYINGSHSGTENEGLYTNGTYTSGSQYTSFTASSITTTIGSSSGGGGPGR